MGSNSLNIKNILNLFLILLPILLISGPFLSDLAISILAVSSLFIIKEKKYYFNYFILFFIFFWLIILTSSFLSENNFTDLKNSVFYFRFALFSLCVWYLLEKNKNILKYIYFVLIFSFSILIFDSIFQYINGYNIFNMEIIVENRISSFFGEELKMGGYFMRISPFLIGLSFFFFNKKKHQKLLPISIIYILLIQITIFLSGERTSFFLFTFTIILFIIFLHEFKKTRFFLLIIYLVSFSFLITSDTPYKKRLIDFTIEQSNINKGTQKKFIFSEQYNEHYRSAWNIFLDNKIFGVGVKKFREVCKVPKYNYSRLTCSTHPHNLPLQLISETGIFSFCIYLIINIFVWYLLLKSLFLKLGSRKKFLNNFQISLLINIAILIWPLAPNGNFFNNWLSILIYYPVGFLLWSFKNQQKMYILSKKINSL